LQNIPVLFHSCHCSLQILCFWPFKITK
jgi:hypothetical protein